MVLFNADFSVLLEKVFMIISKKLYGRKQLIWVFLLLLPLNLVNGLRFNLIKFKQNRSVASEAKSR